MTRSGATDGPRSCSPEYAVYVDGANLSRPTHILIAMPAGSRFIVALRKQSAWVMECPVNHTINHSELMAISEPESPDESIREES